MRFGVRFLLETIPKPGKTLQAVLGQSFTY